MKRKTSMMLILLSLSVLFAAGQSSSFDNVLNFQNRGSGYIFENNQIKGYYMFYRVDKVAKKTFSYQLRILDQNMQEAVSTTMERPKYFYLVESTFNGNAFMFLYYDRKEKAFELVTYNKQAQQISSKRYSKLRNQDIQLYTAYGMLSDEASNPSIYPVGNRGFLRTSLKTRGMRSGYRLEYLSNDLSESESWSIGTPEDSKMIEFATVSSVTEDYATVIVVRRKGAMSKDFKYFVQLLDLHTGEIAFEEALSRKDHNYSVQFCTYDPEGDQMILMGNYYDVGDKALKGKSKGLYAMSLDTNGEQRNLELISWGKDIAQYLDVNEKGRLDEGGWITVHRIVRASDGKMYAIGEEFKKAVSKAGVALNVLSAAGGGSGSGVANIKAVVKDMVIFELGEDLALQDVQVFEKRHNNVLLPQGYGLMGPGMLAYFMKLVGWFDYSYTQQSEDKDMFYSTYFSKVKEEGQRKKTPIFGVIIRDDVGDFSVDQINLETEASEMWVMPAKSGYVAIWEYFNKAQKVDVRLEQVNY
ncbi:MAG: DUF6770 family protein [Bacteroidota bacterium]